MAIAMAAVQFGGQAAAVAGGDVGGVDAQARRQGQRVGQVQRIHGIEAVIVGGGAQIDRAHSPDCRWCG